MNLFDFASSFPDEASCRRHFKEVRLSKGIVCKNCACTQHYWLKSKSMFQCKNCRFRTSLRSGTVMENSKLPFRYWYIAIHLITSTKKSFSALEFQRQIGHKRYEPIWAMLHKIRMIMGQKDDEEQLEGWIELDTDFFDVRGDQKGKKQGKRKRRRKATVLVVVESEPAPRNSKYPKGKRCKRFRMKALDNSKPQSLIDCTSQIVDRKAYIQSRKFAGYGEFKNYFTNHEPTNIQKNEAKFFLPWVHTAITNSKRILFGIFHKVSGKYFQNYLDEFCYKLNRRYQGEKMFENLLLDSLRHWAPDREGQRNGQSYIFKEYSPSTGY